MTNNPYQRPDADLNCRRDDAQRLILKQVIGAQRFLIGAFIAYMLSYLVADIFPYVPSDSALVLLNWLPMLLTIIMGLGVMYGVFRVCSALGWHVVSGIIMALLIVIPIINFVAMWLVNTTATRTIREAGIKVGFFGVSRSQQAMI